MLVAKELCMEVSPALDQKGEYCGVQHEIKFVPE
jgi:hypothetical protein